MISWQILVKKDQITDFECVLPESNASFADRLNSADKGQPVPRSIVLFGECLVKHFIELYFPNRL